MTEEANFLKQDITSIELKRKQELQKQYTGNWVWRAVSALIETKDFDHSPEWMANRLNVSIYEIDIAIKGLIELGIIRQTDKGYVKILKYVYFSDRDLNPELILKDHVLISTQILGRLNPRKKEQPSFYRTAFIASNKALAKEYFYKIETTIKEFMIASAQSTQDRVFALSFSAVGVDHEQEKKGV